MIASADPVHPVAIRPYVGIQCVWVNIGKTVIGMNSSFPGEGEGWFMTVGGLLMHQLDRVPVASDYLIMQAIVLKWLIWIRIAWTKCW